MIAKGISMVLVYVSDVAESVKWYQEVLELPVLYQDQGFASLGVGNQRLGLHAGEYPESSEDRLGSIPVFEVADYQEVKATLASRGCVFYFENQTPNAIFGSFKDPDGNSLQIMQDL
jgi:catechol 2,3-dioxygenase-like lactoylglutathione lyase family enzyme